MQKFSNLYINYYQKLVKSIVGFEFEFYTSRSYYKLLEALNRDLAPIKVHGFRKYHSSFEPDEENFKIEPDLSGGVDLVELVTGPMHYVDAKVIMLKILKILQDYSYTDEKCSMHINISFDKDSEVKLEDLKPLKIILDIDEFYIWKLFPSRKNNFYAKSIKKLIPFKEFKFSTDAMNIIRNNLEIPDTKYYGVNIKNYTEGRLEYRYIGGTDYQYKTKEIMKLLDYFVLLTWNSIDKDFDEEDEEKLLDYLSENISNFKKFNDLESFIGEFPTITLQVDKMDEFSLVKSYYSKIYDKLYDLLSNTYNLRDAIINLDSERMKLEVVDTFVKGIFDLRYLEFVECRIAEGTFYRSVFSDSDVKNSHIESCKIEESEVYNCKLTNCEVDKDSVLEKVYFYGGFLDGEMKSGIFRGGKIGPNAVIGDGVKLVTDDDNYFGTSISSVVKSDKESKKTKKQW